MFLRACCLTLAIFAGAPSTTAHAAKCPGLSAKDVTISGKVTEHLKGAGMMKIETKDCGELTVGIPAKNATELKSYLEECPMGSLALVTGDSIIGILEAKELGCL